MRFSQLFILLTITAAASAQLIPFFQKPSALHQNQQQQPMTNPGIQLPPTDNEPAPPTGDVILSDILSSQRQISVFSSFCRAISTVSSRLDDASKNTTVLAPLNNAISSLPRKPWERPGDDVAAMSEDEAHRNLRRFAEAHVVPVSPWEEGVKVETLGGGTVWWEKRDGGERSVVMPGEVEVERVVSRVANGEVWVLKGVVNYA